MQNNISLSQSNGKFFLNVYSQCNNPTVTTEVTRQRYFELKKEQDDQDQKEAKNRSWFGDLWS